MLYGKYQRTNDRLGDGGNGEVWRCTYGESSVAVKVLRKFDWKRYARFRSEVGVLVSLGQFEGIVPLLDHDLPDAPTASRPAWYAMPIGGSSDVLFTATFRDVVRVFIYIASRLAALHDRGIHHRDIKLGNILLLDGRWCLADFGLAEWPGAQDLTTEHEAIGPRWTQAPEM